MKLFLNRLLETIKDVSAMILLFLINVLIGVGILSIWIIAPMYFLEKINETLAALWFFISLISLIVVSKWQSIKHQLIYLFVEPFQKDNK